MPIKPYPYPSDLPNSTSRFDRPVAGSDKPEPAIVTPDIPAGTFEEKEDNDNGRLSLVFKAGGKTVRGRPVAPYIPSPDIREIVRLAQILQRPILIKGEPGSGKTQLSRAVAYEWYGDNYQQHYFEWIIKSTSKATDGIYTFDHIERLRDAQLAQRNDDFGLKKAKDYRKFGPMGMAFLTSTEENPSILLIDEIDKADIDFPNDLLMELDERRFHIPDSETGETIEATYPPVIFITSNDERELPEAFLRRCLFLYIRFPDDEQMKRIIEAHLPDLVKSQPRDKDFVALAIRQFKSLKDDREKDPTDNKRVSTSELLDWLKVYDYDRRNQTGPFDPDNQENSTRLSELDAFFEHQKNPEGHAESIKAVEGRSLGAYPFYFQTVLKSYAAVQSQHEKKGAQKASS